jgi:ABC-type Fe3+/spermidine/putrescine transport system ATPase subunit
MLEMMELGGRGDRFPRQLSGGQQQRVALARALVFNPNLLLLDEPLSALDTKLRAGLQDELRRLHRRLGATFIFVTHDQEEALSMSDEIAIVNRGRIVQHGTPHALYDRPVNRFVANFLGRSNFLVGCVSAVEGAMVVYEAAGHIFHHRLDDGPLPAVGETVTIALRPEKIAVTGTAPPGGSNTLAGRIKDVGYHGAEYRVSVETANGFFDVDLTTWRSPVAASEGAAVCLHWEADASVLLADTD